MGQFIDFNYVKRHANFEAVLNHYNVDLIGTGDERRCLCPFHDDTDPSMTVNLEKNVFHCHAASCGEKGNVLEFVDGYEGNGLRDAASCIGQICNIALAEPKAGGGKAKPARNTDKAARKPARKRTEAKAKPKSVAPDEESANPPLTFQLKLDPEHEYGQSRSLSPPVIERFEMGYCSKGVMAGRWCFPIHNAQGELVAYIGRYAAADVPADEVKYKLPSGFQKDLVLFNLHRLNGSQTVVVVEGCFDAVRLDELDFPVVALLGTSLSDAQFALLKQAGVTSVVVLLDAGAKKAERKLVHQLSRGFFVRSVALPEDEDPATVSEDFLQERVHPLIA